MTRLQLAIAVPTLALSGAASAGVTAAQAEATAIRTCSIYIDEGVRMRKVVFVSRREVQVLAELKKYCDLAREDLRKATDYYESGQAQRNRFLHGDGFTTID